MIRLRPKLYKSWLGDKMKGGVAVTGNIRSRKASKKYEYKKKRGEIREKQDGPSHENHNPPENYEEVEQRNLVLSNENVMEQSSDNQDEEDKSSSSSDDDIDNTETDDQFCDCFNCQENQTPPSTQDLAFDASGPYADKLELHQKLSPHLDVTKFETLLMILTITMRHGMTGPLIEDLLKFVNSIVGSPSLPTSHHMFKKIFSVDSGLTYHFICEKCNLYLGEHSSFESSSVECGNCKNICNVKPSASNAGNFFITLSVQKQLQEILERSGNHLLPRSKQQSDDGTLGGIHDGKLVKSLTREGMPLSNPNALTLTISTDGGQVFENSCQNSMWPVQATCNELDASVRFQPENMILAALWFGKTSPEMSAFLKPIAEDLKRLETDGVNVKLGNGQEELCPVYTIMCVCDSVAKPKIQNIVQFNGYFGCGYCTQRGVIVPEVGQVRYPCNGKKYKLRTEQSVRDAMMIASETLTSEKGIKGFSPLLLFSTVHLVYGVPIDYMHATLLGCMKRLVGLWLDESSNGKRYYIKKFEANIDDCLVGIVPPSKISTRPTAISKRSVWKAKDWANFLLYWGLSSLENILPNVYWKNFQDLSAGVFLLLQGSISKEDLQEADIRLSRFTKTYNELYGDKHMVYNMHLVSHLVQITEMCGPMAYYSAFSFEGGMGQLVKLVKGTNSVAPQICRKYLACKSLPQLLSVYDISPVVQEFCEDVLTYKRNKNSVSLQGVTLLGRYTLHFLTADQRQLLSEAGFNEGEYVVTFNRAILHGVVVASKAYTRPKKTNDTCVQLHSGEIGIVELIMKSSADSCLMFFTNLRICPGFEHAPHVHVCAGKRFSSTLVLNLNEIRRKCIYFSVAGKYYVTYRPNEFEKDN